MLFVCPLTMVSPPRMNLIVLASARFDVVCVWGGREEVCAAERERESVRVRERAPASIVSCSEGEWVRETESVWVEAANLLMVHTHVQNLKPLFSFYFPLIFSISNPPF